MDEGRIAELDERKRACLRLVYARYDVKSIADELGLSPDGVKYHLKGAREILRVNTSAHAARLLREAEGEADYLPRVAPPKAVADAGPDGDSLLSTEPTGECRKEAEHAVEETMARYTPADLGRGKSFPWPFPTRRRPHNDLSIVTRILLAFACAASLGISVLMVAAISGSIGQLMEQLIHRFILS